MTNFLALYRGPTVSEAALVAVSADPVVVGDFAARLLARRTQVDSADAALQGMDRARRRALRVVRAEAANAVEGLDP
ncbi:MAG: hypothetical protein ACRENX_02930 [Candidatus Dormibacteria bacterium]